GHNVVSSAVWRQAPIPWNAASSFARSRSLELHVQMIRGAHVPQRAESHRPEVELHDAIPYLPSATRAEIHGVHPAVRLAVVHRAVVDRQPHTAVARRDTPHVVTTRSGSTSTIVESAT